MNKGVNYRELSGFSEFEACCHMQKELFNLPERDILPPIFINLLTRKNPKIGFALGAFIIEHEKEKLIGFILATACHEPNSLYGMITGIMPEYRKNSIGFGLFLALKEKALRNNINTFYGIFDPMEGNLAKLYFNKLGMTATSYEPEAIELRNNSFPIDKVLLKWSLNSNKLNIGGKYSYGTQYDFIKNIELLTKQNISNATKLLLEIPDDFILLKQQDPKIALNWRMEIRELLIEYLNVRNYIISDLYTRIINDKRENFYLLEQPSITN